MAAITSSFDSNFCPASDFVKFGNKKKSHGAKSGEYGEWGSSSWPNSTNGHGDGGGVSRCVVMVEV